MTSLRAIGGLRLLGAVTLALCAGCATHPRQVATVSTPCPWSSVAAPLSGATLLSRAKALRGDAEWVIEQVGAAPRVVLRHVPVIPGVPLVTGPSGTIFRKAAAEAPYLVWKTDHAAKELWKVELADSGAYGQVSELGPSGHLALLLQHTDPSRIKRGPDFAGRGHETFERLALLSADGRVLFQEQMRDCAFWKCRLAVSGRGMVAIAKPSGLVLLSSDGNVVARSTIDVDALAVDDEAGVVALAVVSGKTTLPGFGTIRGPEHRLVFLKWSNRIVPEWMRVFPMRDYGRARADMLLTPDGKFVAALGLGSTAVTIDDHSLSTDGTWS